MQIHPKATKTRKRRTKKTSKKYAKLAAALADERSTQERRRRRPSWENSSEEEEEEEEPTEEKRSKASKSNIKNEIVQENKTGAKKKKPKTERKPIIQPWTSLCSRLFRIIFFEVFWDFGSFFLMYILGLEPSTLSQITQLVEMLILVHSRPRSS